MRIIVLLLGLGLLTVILPGPVPSWATANPAAMACDSEVLYIMAGENALHARPSLFAPTSDLDPGTQVCAEETRRRIFTVWYRVRTEHGEEGWIRAAQLGTQGEYLASLPTATPQPTATPAQVPSTPTQSTAPTVEAESSDPETAASCTDAWGTSSVGYRIRSGPGTDFAPTGQHVRLDEQICILEETGDWVHLRKSDGATGYTHKDGITYQAPTDRVPASPAAGSEPPASTSPAVTYSVQLAALTVAPHTHLFTYDRDDWGSGWSDADRDCQNTRHEVLQWESQSSVAFTNSRRCSVSTGFWMGPWSGETFTKASELDIDHHVPLKNAHISGGAVWSPAQKRAYYNDMELEGALQATKRSLNRAKGASGPEAWKPPLQHTWCQYARDWIDVKTKYILSITQAEKSALGSMLDTCEDTATLPTDTGAPAAPPPLPSTPLPTATPIPVPVVVSGGGITLTSCDARAEIVTFTNSGTQAIDLTGYVIHDEGIKFTHVFPAGFVVAPGETWTLISGSDAVADTSRNILLFKTRNIWNNDGDTAYLKQGNSLIDSLACQ